MKIFELPTSRKVQDLYTVHRDDRGRLSGWTQRSLIGVVKRQGRLREKRGKAVIFSWSGIGR